MRHRWFPAALIAAATALGGGAAALTAAGPALAANSPNSAVVIKDAGCAFLDGNGNFAILSSSLIVITSSSNTTLKCSGPVTPSASGTAVQWNTANTGGGLCGTALGPTADWHETVSASGMATLTCHVVGG